MLAPGGLRSISPNEHRPADGPTADNGAPRPTPAHRAAHSRARPSLPAEQSAKKIKASESVGRLAIAMESKAHRGYD